MPRQKKTNQEKVEVKKESSKKEFYQAIGRRKESTARVRLTVGEDKDMIVNNRPIDNYFPGEIDKIIYLMPLQLTDSLNRFKVTVKVSGGGLNGQLGAVSHGIARALLKVDNEKYRSILKKAGLLTRDPRAKERRKAGFAHKARARKQSPKR